MTFSEKQLEFTIELGQGSFGDSGANVIDITNHRSAITIVHTGLPGYSTAQIRIYGMTLSLMNQLSTLGKPLIYDRLNKITVKAGDSASGLGVVFVGILDRAWADLNTQPDVSFNITAFTGLIDATKPVAPTSYSGTADVAQIISGLAIQMGYAFENNGVSVILSNPYFHGTARQQVIACADAAGIYAFFDDVNTTLAIWPFNGNRGSSIPLLSSDSGMVGYPSYSGQNIAVKSVFNPNLKFGGQVQVQSVITPACGVWIINKLIHNLQSQIKQGEWFSDIEAYRLGQSPTLPES